MIIETLIDYVVSDYIGVMNVKENPEDKLCPLRDKSCVGEKCQWWDKKAETCQPLVSLYAINENIYNCYQEIMGIVPTR